MTALLWLQWGAMAAGVVVLLFFASFTGYYFRNRRAAMQLHRQMQEHLAGGGVPGAPEVPPESQDQEDAWRTRV